jgi:anti-sigma factor RsiW
MTDHLTPAQLSALTDGELAGDELTAVTQHVDNCLPCAKDAVNGWLLKAAVAKAGRLYEAPTEFRERMAGLAARETTKLAARRPSATMPPLRSSQTGRAFAGWAAAAVLLLALGSWEVVQYRGHSTLNDESAALVTEACDLHIAMLAANQQPQVISSDRHTVKPWFQGKLPFSFNLPETLPADTTLDGANLTYLHNHPVAQLLFSIGRHRVSVFVEEKSDGELGALKTAHDGFNVSGFETGDLDVIAVSDVDPARLAALVSTLQAVETQH